MQTMTQALKEYDQIIALSASEFFASLVQVWFTAAHEDASNLTLNQKVDQIKLWLPQILPELLICAKVSEADKRNIIQTKEEDLFLELGDGKVDSADEDELDKEEDYTVGRGGASNTTLRKSAAYTLAQFSKTFQEETYQVLQPCLEKAIAKQVIIPGQAVYHINDPALDMKEAGILILGTICD